MTYYHKNIFSNKNKIDYAVSRLIYIAITSSNTKREGKMRYKYVYFFNISKPNFDENKL